MDDTDSIESHPDGLQPADSKGGGVYTTRAKPQSINSKAASVDVEECSIDEKVLPDERDVRKRQVFRGWTLAWLSYQSVGVIYGDIGTSPLYTYSSTFSSDPSREDILGACSLIIWSLTIMVTIKYILIVLYADDEGEGGTFALYSLISRYANIVSRDPREERMVKIERHKTGDLGSVNCTVRRVMERSKILQWVFKVIGVLGVALLLADGVLTPAQSILGAIQGITVVNSNIHTSTVIGVTCAILVVVFLVQPLGITKIASTYAPIVILWLLFNLTFGIYNIATYDASVFKAFSPYFAGHFLEANGRSGWLQLGGIILAFTGVETLFADVGAFSRRAVQISWLCFAYPCLLFSYIGQAAHISVVPSAYANPFYLTVPPGMLYPSLVVAILACIVASQATITGAFQLLAQIMKLSYFPQIELVHTSKKFYGQIYIPLANWIMMIGTVIVAAVFNNTTALGEAYGSCVILVTFLTTCMVAVVALIVWRLPFYVVLPVFSIFALWDGMFLSAALTKVPHGAWVTLMIAAALSAIFILWRYGKEQQWRSEATDDIPLSQTVQVESDGDTSTLRLQSAYGGNVLSRTQGFGIFFDKTGNPSYTPAVFLHFVQKFQAMQDVTVFFHLRPLSLPSVDPADRFTVMRCYAHGSERKKRAIPNCYRLVVRHGYTDEVITPNLGLLVFDQIRKFLVEQQRSIGVRPFERSGQLASELQTLEDAYSQRVVYIVGKEQLRIKKGTNIFRRLALMVFLWIRDQTRTKVQSLNVRVDRLVEVGFVKDI